MKRLPVECVSHIISFTSPRDACRSSAVSSVFRRAVDSEIVWDKFLPHDYKRIISSSSSLNSMSKKDLYFYLCTHPIIIGDGHMSFALEKQSGKKCYMVGARGLAIAWGDTPANWQWITPPLASRFSQVAELKLVLGLHIKANIETKNLSQGTTYAAYLVYQLSQFKSGFGRSPIVLRINYRQSAVVSSVHSVILDPTPPRARHRGDGWMEIEMGCQFLIEQGDGDDVVECSVTEGSNLKSGLIVEGIELRPKHI